jgi:preprotein translocase subunit SecF
LGEASPETYDKVRQAVKAEAGDFKEYSFSSIGSSVSDKLKKNAVYVIFAVILLISIFIGFAFRNTSGPVKSWAYGASTLVSLFHDVAIPAGVIAVLGHYGQVELDTNFIVALLVIMGFSVHDTIVVFDRIRENLGRERGTFSEIVNISVRQTIARSLNTSFTLVLVLVALLVLGPASLHYFVLILLIGVIAGAYSSIFVASPVLLLLSGGGRPKKRS